MKRTLITLFLLSLITITASAQTQQGFVKTKGRMVNGQHVQGKGLPGATVAFSGGRNVAVQKDDGSFSFPVPSKTFMVQSVQKKGYELVDVDVTKKPYQYSVNPLYLLMETPEQQMEDLLDAQEKISNTLKEQLKKARTEIQRLKGDNKITEDEYRQRIAQLMQDQQNNQKLIADMAKEYAQMDYDQMDELNRQISDAILNGELTKADSLLRSKGDMRSRDAEITRRQQAEAQEKAELAQRQQNLEASEAGTKKLLEDFADDCMKYHNMFKLENKHDSAAYYIELRANRDTMNAEWQFDAAGYSQEQNQYKESAFYYERTLTLYRRLAIANPQAYEPDVATTLNNMANLYSDIQRFDESEAMHKEALEIRRRLAASNPQAYEPNVANTLNDLAILYIKTKRFNEGKMMLKEAIEIKRRLAASNPQAYEPDVVVALNNLAILYYNTQRFTESDAMFKEVLGTYRRLAASNPQTYEPEMAKTLYNLAILYSDTQRFTESEAMYKEALEIRRRLADSNPQAFEPALANTLNNLAALYSDTQRFTESETMYKEALEIKRRLAASNPQAYEPDLTNTLNSMASLYMNTQRFDESEAMYKEILETQRRLASSNPQAYKQNVARTLGNMSFLYILMKEFVKAEQTAREGISLAPSKHVINSLLADALLFQGKYPEAEQIYRQHKDELKYLFLDDLKQFTEAGVIPKELKADVKKIKKILKE